MFNEFTISPYPGLRSFSEEESLFFKGRDENIQEIIKLLQANKFLMVTGASGDGKSSVIFAGLVPNARAGFFKASYNRWEIAHFRPERTPIKNFAAKLSGIFNSPEETLSTELSRGYGSLVDLYKGSDLYKDESTAEWQNADEETRRTLGRSTANMLIIVDQFEEFFTNPENFRNGAPTEEAQVLVNLLLETAKISLRDDIPIYVVFTMRSDYTGQCAAFRELPEFIGFSQFFVPRLKRKELKQIIEEPAELNGNSISSRLVERILYDLSEGIDQLPVLQHVLSKVWLTAGKGSEEMDLIHYAKVGGMPADELPTDDQKDFNKWFAGLPEWKQQHYDNPGLNRILDIHADDLYESAWEYYNNQHNTLAISKQEAKFIIAMTFACLTKIDHSRAVRNRMTLQEITDIINQPKLMTPKVVGSVINIYREQGNTFVRPFIDENVEESSELKPDSVLDITHEALIRNWQRLAKWADKEYEYYDTFLDFEKQLQKWLDSNKDSGYLLPIGPLTFFENWQAECRPNKFWINRYNTESKDVEENLSHSKETLSNSKEFLKKSARRVIISKTFMKYGTMRIATAFAVVLVFLLSGFFYYDAEQKQNKAVLDNMAVKARELLPIKEVGSFAKSIYLLNLERVNQGSMIHEFDNIPGTEEKLDVSINTYIFMLIFDKNINIKEKYDVIDFFINTLVSSELSTEKTLYYYNLIINLLGYDYYLNNTAKIGSFLQEQTSKLPGLIDRLIDEEKIDDILILNKAIENYINWNSTPVAGIEHILEQLSPFEADGLETFNKFYPQKGGISIGQSGNISHNAGYHEMASLYATIGDLASVKQATDSILKYNNDVYFDVMSYNHGSNILGYFAQFDHLLQAENYLSYLSEQSGVSKRKIMNFTLDHGGGINFLYLNVLLFNDGNYNPGLSILHRRGSEFLFDLTEKIISEEENGDSENFYLALLYKQRGSYLSWQQQLTSNSIPKITIYFWYDKAVTSYASISEKFKNEEEEINYRYWNNGIRVKSFTHKYFFLYPDYFYDQWQSDKYVSTAFMEYLLEKELFNEFYKSSDELEVINDWLANYNEFYPFFNTNDARQLASFNPQILDRIDTAISSHPQADGFDYTFLHLLLTNKAFTDGDTEIAFQYYSAIDLAEISSVANRWQYLNYTFVYNQLTDIIKALALKGNHDEAMKAIESLPDYQYKAYIYSVLANYLYTHEKQTTAFIYLDSAFVNEEKLDPNELDSDLNPHMILINTLAGIGSQALDNKAKSLFVEMSPNIKDEGLGQYISGIAYEGNYYRAVEAIPENGSSTQELFYYSDILNAEANKKGDRQGWETLARNWDFFNSEYIIFQLN